MDSPTHDAQAASPSRLGGIFFALTWRQWFAHIAAVEHDFWSRAKTRTVQFMAGTASALWAVSLLAEQDTTFQRRGFTMMREQAPAWVWAAIFFGHTLCVFIVRWVPPEMPRFAWLTSFYGFVIWTYYVLSNALSLHHFSIGASFEVVGVYMLGWSLRRAGRDLHGDANGRH